MGEKRNNKLKFKTPTCMSELMLGMWFGIHEQM